MFAFNRRALAVGGLAAGLVVGIALTMAATVAAQEKKQEKKRNLLIIGESKGYQHDSISHAIATIERLGWQSGDYDTFIRTDSQLITRHTITFGPNVGIATGEQFNVRNLDYFDAIFFFGATGLGASTIL